MSTDNRSSKTVWNALMPSEGVCMVAVIGIARRHRPINIGRG